MVTGIVYGFCKLVDLLIYGHAYFNWLVMALIIIELAFEIAFLCLYKREKRVEVVLPLPRERKSCRPAPKQIQFYYNCKREEVNPYVDGTVRHSAWEEMHK